jgi:hypothetical protein
MSTKGKGKPDKAIPIPTAVRIAKPHAMAPAAPRSSPRAAAHARVAVFEGHVENAMRAAAEMDASASFAHDFGKCAPGDAPAVAEALRVAHAWSEEQRRADAWRAYVADQRERAWSAVMSALAPLMAGFDGAAVRDPSIIRRYPALGSFVNVRSASAKRSAATRKRKKDAAARAAAKGAKAATRTKNVA